MQSMYMRNVRVRKNAALRGGRKKRYCFTILPDVKETSTGNTRTSKQFLPVTMTNRKTNFTCVGGDNGSFQHANNKKTFTLIVIYGNISFSPDNGLCFRSFSLSQIKTCSVYVGNFFQWIAS